MCDWRNYILRVQFGTESGQFHPIHLFGIVHRLDFVIIRESDCTHCQNEHIAQADGRIERHIPGHVGRTARLRGGRMLETNTLDTEVVRNRADNHDSQFQFVSPNFDHYKLHAAPHLDGRIFVHNLVSDGSVSSWIVRTTLCFTNLGGHSVGVGHFGSGRCDVQCRDVDLYAL